MKFWTVQPKEVLDIIMKEDIYIADFKKSTYLQELPELMDLYSLFLESFNAHNDTNLPGLVFAFAQSNDSNLFEIPDIESFQQLMIEKEPAVGGFWNAITKKGACILELEYNVEEFNPIFIDFNDFQFLMPPITVPLPPYTEPDIARLVEHVHNGTVETSIFPSYVMQAHLPFIRKENIICGYEMFPLK